MRNPIIVPSNNSTVSSIDQIDAVIGSAISALQAVSMFAHGVDNIMKAFECSDESEET